MAVQLVSLLMASVPCALRVALFQGGFTVVGVKC